MSNCRKHLSQFIQQDAAYVISTELLLLATISVLGLLVGIQNIRNTLFHEFEDMVESFGFLNQSYEYLGTTLGDPLNGGPTTQGGLFQDDVDEDARGSINLTPDGES
jgi:hypothetical protein